jgi:hypothetical protein
MGRSSDQSDVEEKRVYKVFITYSTQVVDKLTQNILKIKGSKDKDQSDSGSEPLYSIYADFQRSGVGRTTHRTKQSPNGCPKLLRSAGYIILEIEIV